MLPLPRMSVTRLVGRPIRQHAIANATGLVQDSTRKNLKQGDAEKRRRVEQPGGQAQNFSRRGLLDDPPQDDDEPAGGNAHYQ